MIQTWAVFYALLRERFLFYFKKLHKSIKEHNDNRKILT